MTRIAFTVAGIPAPRSACAPSYEVRDDRAGTLVLSCRGGAVICQPMSRADRNRLRRGEVPRIELLKSTWWSLRFAIWEGQLLHGGAL